MDAKPSCNVAISPEVHQALRAVSVKTGIKIKILVDKALRQAYPISRSVKGTLK